MHMLWLRGSICSLVWDWKPLEKCFHQGVSWSALWVKMITLAVMWGRTGQKWGRVRGTSEGQWGGYCLLFNHVRDGNLNWGGVSAGGGGQNWSVFRYFLRMSKYNLDWRTSKFWSTEWSHWVGKDWRGAGKGPWQAGMRIQSFLLDTFIFDGDFWDAY